MEEKINALRLISRFCPSQKETFETIIACMTFDNDLATFVIEQTKFMLFTSEGKGNPSEEELTTACLSSVISISMCMEGAIMAYDIYLKEGLDAYLKYMSEILYGNKVG